ncbi:MAG: histidine kinase [Bacteroidota bacterium]
MKTSVKSPLITACFIILFWLLNMPAFCQIMVQEKGDKLEVYDHYKLIDTLHATPQQIAKVHQIQRVKQLVNEHYYYDFPFSRNIGIRFDNSGKTKSEIYEGKDWGDGYFFKSVIIDGNCDVEFTALDVTEKNAADYRYRVVQNGTQELVTWTTPSIFKHTVDKRFKYAYLGRFPYVEGQVLKVEIYNVKNIKQQDAMLVDWRKVVPADVYGTVQYTNPIYRKLDNGLVGGALTEVKHAAFKHTIMLNGKPFEVPFPASQSFIESPSKNDIRIRLGDSLQNIDFDINNGHKLYNYRVYLMRDIDGQKDTTDFGETNSHFLLYKEFWKTPGKYKITFTPKIHRHGGQPITVLHNLATSISFTVLPPLNQSHSINIKTFLLIIFIMLTTGAYMFVQYRAGQKKKLAAEAQNRQIATLQLQSVRSQLNPHFMFNALAGIQNLINKNEIDLANKYLARFARLTRNVLDDGNKELTSIEHETDLLNDYLQMEQMRFGFQYQIDIDDIDQQIEIPAMLLQPFAENAVKHGVSTLKEKGLIKASIIKSKTDLIITISDNGKGFGDTKATGLGTKLCEERIALLNRIYKNTVILLKTDTGVNGTTVTIELKNWL